VIIDETTTSEALHGIEVVNPPDLLTRVRRGGRQRLLRRRSYIAATGVAAGTAAVSAGFALWPGNDAEVTTPVAGQHSQALSDLYAAPPAPGSQCNGGESAKTDAAGGSLATTYSHLLLLPVAQDIGYGFVRSSQDACSPPHVALTALQLDGDTVTKGLLVEGPNAPTAVEAGRTGPDVSFGGDTGNQPVDGQPAVEFTIPQNGHTDAYWTEPDGGQWHAAVRDMSQEQAVALLNLLQVDGVSGTATLNNANQAGWTIEPAVEDEPQTHGWFTASWVDPHGHKVNLDVTQTRDRLDQIAAGAYSGRSYTQVRGHQAIYSALGGLGRGVPDLIWQEAPDVQVDLTVVHATESEVKQIAASLTLTDPSDPRISRD
jgi:hypothetical protein